MSEKIARSTCMWTWPVASKLREQKGGLKWPKEPSFWQLMSMDSIKLTPCPYSSCDARIEALRVNPRSDGVLNGFWRSWSYRAKLQIPQLGIPAPPWDSGIWRRSWLIVDDACSLWRVGTRTALCRWCIWRVVSHCGNRAKVMLGWIYWVMVVYKRLHAARTSSIIASNAATELLLNNQIHLLVLLSHQHSYTRRDI